MGVWLLRICLVDWVRCETTVSTIVGTLADAIAVRSTLLTNTMLRRMLCSVSLVPSVE